MLEADQYTARCRLGMSPQRGVAAVEFAIVASVFFLFIFGAMELARVMYVFNTLQEVTRRAAVAAANADFHEPALSSIRQKAIFRTSPGPLILGDPVTDDHVRIDYLALVRNADGSITPTRIPTTDLPANPAQNRVICNSNANDPSCIRLVRARICETGDNDCDRMTYKTIFPLITLSVKLPLATTIIPARSMGYTPTACLPCGE